jgi:hypothetical protein
VTHVRRFDIEQCRVKPAFPTAALGLFLVLLASWWLALAPPTQAQTQPPDLATYTLWLREAQAAAGRGDRLGLEDAAGRLTATASVRLPSGATIAVDNAWLAEALRDVEPDMAAIGARLGAILDALALPQSAAPEDARARLAEILSRPPFVQPADDPPPSWLRDLFEWLARVLEQLFRPVGHAASAGARPIAWAIGIVGAVLLLAVIVYLVRGLRRGLVAEATTGDDDPEANLTAKTALELAGGLARGGDYRTAVRYLYLSALLWLDERGVLRYDRALTNREYLDRVRDNPALRDRLAPVVDTFDRVWYGHLPIDEVTFAAYQRQVEQLRSEQF